MALLRISNSPNLLTTLSQISYTARTPLGEIQYTRYASAHRMKNLHITSVRRYPDPPTIPLPTNISEIFANETGRFTPERTRDIAAPILLYGKNDCTSFSLEQLIKPKEHSRNLENCNDTHIDSYDCFGTVSLNGTMQSNVPKPFCSNGKSTHLNMPGGQWARDGKFIAEDMQKSHYRSNRLELKPNKCGLISNVTVNNLFQAMYNSKYIYSMGYSTNKSLNNLSKSNDNQQQQEIKEQKLLSKKERLKIIIKDYGITITIFHIGISLISLGACYAAVVRGIDLKPVIQSIFKLENEQVEGILGNSSTFLVAYGIHKLLTPIRLSITLGTTPFLIKRLRKLGILKSSKEIKLNT